MERSQLTQPPTLVALPSQTIADSFELLNAIEACIVVFSPEGRVEFVNQCCKATMGVSSEELLSRWYCEFSPAPYNQLDPLGQSTLFPHSPLYWLIPFDHHHWIEWSMQPLMTSQDTHYVMATGRLVPAAPSGEGSVQFTQFSAHLAQRLQGVFDLQESLQTISNEVRTFLRVERIAIYQIQAVEEAQFIVESAIPNRESILGRTFHDPCFNATFIEQYRHGRISVIDDVYRADLAPCYVSLLRQADIRASLIVPIVHNQQLWGLICAHQCSTPRHWQPHDVDLLRHLAHQIAIVVQKSDLHHQVQQLNSVLERQVQDRTDQLEQALAFEEILKRITDRVRDSLDEAQILQTAVNELGKALEVACCDTGLYNTDCTTSTISYEYAPLMPSALNKTFDLSETIHIYERLLQGHYVQFCDISFPKLRTVRRRFAMLACPIYDNQGTLGDLRLFKRNHKHFSDLEIRLVQQVANQCAIAIRQARLYQATESQVEELANLIRLKDEFLSRVSHELRTPVSNMKMAIQMLGITLNQERPFLPELAKPPAEQSRLAGYYRVLRDECEREISLLNDLLDLQQLDSGTHSAASNLVYLSEWLPLVLNPFQKRAQAQKQTFDIALADDLPPLIVSASSLERILRELLDNACKYTPTQERISVRVWSSETHVSFEVTNTGAEIPETQLPRIFDRFYWVPTRDRWERGGTGLGLALVQRLTKQMGGVITVSSHTNMTRFCVELPTAETAPPDEMDKTAQ